MPRPSRWDEIVQAAAEEFRERGYDAATLEAIAGRVGILKGSLYNYITHKDDLLFAVIEEPARRLLAELTDLSAASDQPALLRLHRLFVAQIGIFSDHHPAAFVYLQQLGRPSHREEFREMDARYIRCVETIIADGIRTGEFSASIRPSVAARAIVGMLDWMQHWYEPRSSEDDGAIAQELLSIAVGGLAGGGIVRTMLSTEPAALPAPGDSYPSDDEITAAAPTG
jgi:TetR/AcrR family transcriptional regulator, cholesterol catabolism regulator